MSPEMLLAMYNPKETWVGFPPAEAYNLSVYLEAGTVHAFDPLSEL